MPKKQPVAVAHPKPIPVSIDHSFAIEAGMLRARLERDLGEDPSTAEAELASMASLWCVLVRRAFRLGLVGVAADATVQARQCLQALGLRRRARDVTPGGARPLAAWLTQGHVPPPSPAVDCQSQPLPASAPDPPAPAGPDANAPAPAEPGGPPPGATSAAPPALAHGGPGAQENRDGPEDLEADGVAPTEDERCQS